MRFHELRCPPLWYWMLVGLAGHTLLGMTAQLIVAELYLTSFTLLLFAGGGVALLLLLVWPMRGWRAHVEDSKRPGAYPLWDPRRYDTDLPGDQTDDGFSVFGWWAFVAMLALAAYLLTIIDGRLQMQQLASSLCVVWFGIGLILRESIRRTYGCDGQLR